MSDFYYKGVKYTLHEGPKGGKYIMENGKKRYVKLVPDKPPEKPKEKSQPRCCECGKILSAFDLAEDNGNTCYKCHLQWAQ